MTVCAQTIDIKPRYPLNVGDVRHADITLVGCGGTGSFLAGHLCRLAYDGKRHGVAVNLTFVDPDRVEEKNVGRQDFTPAMIGLPKAETLAKLYARRFGLAIEYHNEPFKPAHLQRNYSEGRLRLVIGAVDNTAARADIAEAGELDRGRLWWLDCGNGEQSGQVILGNKGILRPEISPFGFCIALPLPCIIQPELVTPEADKPVSCADAVARAEQSLMVNQQVAGIAAVYVYRLLWGEPLDRWGTFFDLLGGSTRSEYIVN